MVLRRFLLPCRSKSAAWLRSLAPDDGADVIQFIPLIISSGGNSGSQATLVIRAMALGEVGLRHWWRILVRECMSGFTLGTMLCVIG